MKENLPFERYLPCDGLTYQIKGIKYTIRAKLRTQKYPYKREYVDLTAEHQEIDKYFGVKTWFLDLISSESKTCEILFNKMEKSLLSGQK